MDRWRIDSTLHCSHRGPCWPRSRVRLATDRVSWRGLGFEAYANPEGECLKDVAVNGTEVTYIDPAFLEHKFAGLLRVEVKGAKGLIPMEVGGASVAVICG